MGNVVWRQVNMEPYEYAVQQGPHGDEFVKLLDGSCLRRSIQEIAMCIVCGKSVIGRCEATSSIYHRVN